MIGSGENFTLTKDNMPKLKEELQMAVRQIANFEKLKNQIADDRDVRRIAH